KITIADDGAGININELKAKALALGFYSKQELQQFSEQQSLMLIFEQNLSTVNKVDLISGQGVGLSAVYAELKKIQGSVIVSSLLGQGTALTFTIPIPKYE
ncbi:partial Chemotaxis protein CheA, partial [Patescibacteria group bacterium]